MKLNSLISLRKWYSTRAGKPVEIWCIDPKKRMSFSVKGHLLTKTVQGTTKVLDGAWTRTGKWPRNDTRNHPMDLIEVTEQEWKSLTESFNLGGK